MGFIIKVTKFLAIYLLVLMHNLEIFSGSQCMVESSLNIDCRGKCAYRCSKASRQRLCRRACNTCCQRCHCVPPGTSGNRDLCPCYANMTTRSGKLKCP